jgi:putative oxidoreductase
MKHDGLFGKCKIFTQGYAYFLFRLLIGLLFLLHSLTKYGVIGGKPAVAVWSLFGIAGIIEFIVGVLIILGLWTRPAALLGSLEMLYVWFFVHTSKGVWNPLANGGELAVLFFAAFLVIMVYGAGKWALEKAWSNKEFF